MFQKNITGNYPEDIQNETLQRYVRGMAMTESPAEAHIWSFISACAAAAGRRISYDTGLGQLFPNMLVWLVGTPGSRKSTAINDAQKLLRDATNVRFAPQDTSGHRQGLLRSIAGIDEKGNKDEVAIHDDVLDSHVDTTLNAFDILDQPIGNAVNDDAEHMYIVASELQAFIGGSAFDLLSCIGKLWDGEPYDYVTKEGSMIIEKPLINMLAGTTQAQINKVIPVETIGQGFMSRLILVYARRKDKRIARRRVKKLSGEDAGKIKDVLKWIYRQSGIMHATEEAGDELDRIYVDMEPEVGDSRFLHYIERRQDHLEKVAMIMALMRRSMLIEMQDVKDAQLILEATEEKMPEALGEFGLGKLATANQHIVDTLKKFSRPMPSDNLYMLVHSLVTEAEFMTCVEDLCTAKKLKRVKMSVGNAQIMGYMYNDSKAIIAAKMAEDIVTVIEDNKPE